MVKCLECGFEAPRLQWSHFKYKCTGKFKNGREYMQYYPGEKVVDAELSKKTGITLENLVNKYGEDAGKIRWDSYRHKQAITNSFEYKKEKYGWTEEEFKDFNRSRAVTLRNQIEKYGEEVGLQKWEEYCERQRYTNTLDYFVEKYQSLGNDKWLEYNAAKKHYSAVYNGKINSSMLEKDFIEQLEYNLNEIIEHTYKTSQYFLWDYDRKKSYFYDVCCNRRKKIIEINGDYWHANPLIYDENQIIAESKVIEIWERDRFKQNFAINQGYQVLVIWEKDFKNDSKGTIEHASKWFNKINKDNRS